MFSKFFSKIVFFLDNMEKYGAPRQSTDDNIMLRRKYEIFLPNDKGTDTNTHSKYVIFIAFPRQQWLREHACYVVRILPVLLWTNAVQPADQSNTVTDRGTDLLTYWLPVCWMREENFKFIFCEV
jgi:hypothetical protein